MLLARPIGNLRGALYSYVWSDVWHRWEHGRSRRARGTRDVRDAASPRSRR